MQTPDIHRIDLPIHPRARAALPHERWEALTRAYPLTEEVRSGEEILNWERNPERGVLHDPPERVYPLPLQGYFDRRSLWGVDAALPWPRGKAFLKAWAQQVGMVAYGINARGRGPVAACLLWHIPPKQGEHSPTVYIPDVIWDPAVDIRNPGRYLLQDLYLRHPEAWIIVDMVPSSSPLNRVLMALGFRVYQRWRERVSGFHP